MGLLNDAQQAAVKKARALAWTRVFTVETTTAGVKGPGYYATSSQLTLSSGLKGDWAWRDEQDRRGREGGVVDEANLLLSTDILNSGTLLNRSAVLVVDGQRCVVTGSTTYPEFGEIVIAAIRAR